MSTFFVFIIWSRFTKNNRFETLLVGIILWMEGGSTEPFGTLNLPQAYWLKNILKRTHIGYELGVYRVRCGGGRIFSKIFLKSFQLNEKWHILNTSVKIMVSDPHPNDADPDLG